MIACRKSLSSYYPDYWNSLMFAFICQHFLEVTTWWEGYQWPCSGCPSHCTGSLGVSLMGDMSLGLIRQLRLWLTAPDWRRLPGGGRYCTGTCWPRAHDCPARTVSIHLWYTIRSSPGNWWQSFSPQEMWEELDWPRTKVSRLEPCTSSPDYSLHHLQSRYSVSYKLTYQTCVRPSRLATDKYDRSGENVGR